LKVVVLAPIFILATTTITIIAVFDPAELSAGAVGYYFNYKAKTETSKKPDPLPTSQEQFLHQTGISKEHTSATAQLLDADGRCVVVADCNSMHDKRR